MVLWGVDKLLHMAACFFITTGTFFIMLASRECDKRSHENIPVETASNRELDVENPGRGSEYVATTDCNFRQCIQKDWVLIVTASSFALLIGIAKEIGDMYNFWWICQTKNDDGSIVGCDASLGDFIADIIGVVVADGFIFVAIYLWNSFQEKKSPLIASYTMTRTASDTEQTRDTLLAD